MLKKLAEALGMVLLCVIAICFPLSIIALIFFVVPTWLGLPYWIPALIGGVLVLAGVILERRQLKIAYLITLQCRKELQWPGWYFVPIYPSLFALALTVLDVCDSLLEKEAKT